METTTHRRLLIRAALLATGLATAANLVLYAGGRAAEVPFGVPAWGAAAGQVSDVTAVQVAVSSLLPLLIGTAALALAAGRATVLRALLIAAAAFTVLSLAVPLTLDTDGATRGLLAAMHVVAGGAFVGSVWWRAAEALGSPARRRSVEGSAA